MLRIVVVTGGILAALLLQSAAAQTLYKSTMPDGSVVYGDKPAPDAAKVEETRPDIKKGGIGGATPREQEALKEMEKARAQREADRQGTRRTASGMRRSRSRARFWLANASAPPAEPPA
jgi:hypothetical protein